MNKSTKEDQELYDNIISLFDYSEKVLESIEQEGIKNPESQLVLAEPLVKQAIESTEILAETYLDFLKGDSKANDAQKRKVEQAIRKIFTEIVKFADSLDLLLKDKQNAEKGSR